VQATSLCVYVGVCQQGVIKYVGVCQPGVVSVQATSLCVCRCVSARCRQCASDVSVCMLVCVCEVLSVCKRHLCVGVRQRGVVSVQVTSPCVCRRVSARCRQCASHVSVCM